MKPFSIEGKANLRQDALVQFGLMEAELTGDLRLTAAAVLRVQWSQHKEQPKAPPARTARRDRVPPGVISPEQGEEEQGAEEEEASKTWTDSDNSSDEQDGSPPDTTRTPLLEDSHQHGLMLAAFREVGNDYTVLRIGFKVPSESLQNGRPSLGRLGFREDLHSDGACACLHTNVCNRQGNCTRPL